MRRDLKLHDAVIAVQRLLGVTDNLAADGKCALLLDRERCAHRIGCQAGTRQQRDGNGRGSSPAPNAGRRARSGCRQDPPPRIFWVDHDVTIRL